MGRWITKNGVHVWIENGNEYQEKSLKQRLAERYAINSYISSESYLINEYLRNGYDLDERQKEIIKNLDSALEDEDNYEGIVTRSLTFYSNEAVKRFLKQHEIGKTVTYSEFLSCTASENYYNPSGQVQLHIYSHKGKNMIKYNPDEAEILYKRNSTFKVINRYIKNGCYVIELEEE